MIDRGSLPLYNRGMNVKHRIVEDPLDYLPIDWRYAALFFACLVVAGIAIVAAG